MSINNNNHWKSESHILLLTRLYIINGSFLNLGGKAVLRFCFSKEISICLNMTCGDKTTPFYFYESRATLKVIGHLRVSLSVSEAEIQEIMSLQTYCNRIFKNITGIYVCSVIKRWSISIHVNTFFFHFIYHMTLYITLYSFPSSCCFHHFLLNISIIIVFI